MTNDSKDIEPSEVDPKIDTATNGTTSTNHDHQGEEVIEEDKSGTHEEEQKDKESDPQDIHVQPQASLNDRDADVTDSFDVNDHQHAAESSQHPQEENQGCHQESDSIDYGYEVAAPQPRNHKRRSSLLGHIMAWAGAVNQEHFEEEHTGQAGREYGSRRVSMDTAVPSTKIVSYRRRCASSDDVDLIAGDGYDSEGEVDTQVGHEHDIPRAHRRSSLHAMVESAMAYVNLKPDPNAEELCPFGTRRDSLF